MRFLAITFALPTLPVLGCTTPRVVVDGGGSDSGPVVDEDAGPEVDGGAAPGDGGSVDGGGGPPVGVAAIDTDGDGVPDAPPDLSCRGTRMVPRPGAPTTFSLRVTDLGTLLEPGTGFWGGLMSVLTQLGSLQGIHGFRLTCPQTDLWLELNPGFGQDAKHTVTYSAWMGEKPVEKYVGLDWRTIRTRVEQWGTSVREAREVLTEPDMWSRVRAAHVDAPPSFGADASRSEHEPFTAAESGEIEAPPGNKPSWKAPD
jgi:hypothetical protein